MKRSFLLILVLIGLAVFVWRGGMLPGYVRDEVRPNAVAPSHAAAAQVDSKPLEQQVARIVAAVTNAARENAQRPRSRTARKGSKQSRLEGDALADLYIRTAAQAALAELESPAERAFLVALGFALDRSRRLAREPVVRLLVGDVETPADQQARQKDLGNPSLGGRSDWLLHFAVSASLTALSGVSTAEAMGIQKEISDARALKSGRGTGFSFRDLAANDCGRELATRLLQAEEQQREPMLRVIVREFRGNDFLPDLSDLEEGLSFEEFEENYGSTSDERFTERCRQIRARVLSAPGWQRLQPSVAK